MLWFINYKTCLLKSLSEVHILVSTVHVAHSETLIVWTYGNQVTNIKEIIMNITNFKVKHFHDDNMLMQ